MDKNPTSTFKSGGISNSAVVIGVFFLSWVFFKTLMGNEHFFLKLWVFLFKVHMGNQQILVWFKFLMGRSAHRSPVRRPTMDGGLESARSAHSCQATEEGVSGTKHARKGKEKAKE